MGEGYFPEPDQVGVHATIGRMEAELQANQPSSGPSRPGRFYLGRVGVRSRGGVDVIPQEPQRLPEEQSE